MDQATLIALTLPTLAVLVGSLVNNRQFDSFKNEMRAEIATVRGEIGNGNPCRPGRSAWINIQNYAFAATSSGIPASLRFFKNGIIARNSAPTRSIELSFAASRMSKNFLRPVRFSSSHLRAKSPD